MAIIRPPPAYDYTIKPLNRNLEAMARQLYDYWFVQFDFPDENGRPYKSSGGKMVWNDKLKREIPQGWFADNILLISEIKVGGTPSKAKKEYWDGGKIPFFGPTDVKDSTYQLDTTDHITQAGLDHCASSLFKEGDIILTARGSIGKLVIVGMNMAMNQSCYALSPKYHNTPYLYFLSKELIEWMKAKGSGSVFKSFNAQDVENSILCIALQTIIEKFTALVQPIFNRIRNNSEAINELQRQRDELLPLLMNGQVSVMPTEVNCDLSQCCHFDAVVQQYLFILFVVCCSLRMLLSSQRRNA
jgi:type I restriction enzyme S subunit